MCIKLFAVDGKCFLCERALKSTIYFGSIHWGELEKNLMLLLWKGIPSDDVENP